MKRKRIVSMLMAATMCLTFVPLTSTMKPTAALTADAVGTTNQGLKYEITEGEICITGHTDELPSEVVIPAEIEGVPVTSIGFLAFSECKNLTSISLPDSVTSISAGAFENCTELISITIPDGITNIEYHTFMNCQHLTGITIPDSVTRIGDGAFMGCTDLTSITLTDRVKSIGWGAFECCYGLTSILIPDSVTSIGGGAFMECDRLTQITIPDGLTDIGWHAFYDTPWLDVQRAKDPLVVVNSILIDGLKCFGDVTIPDGVTSICDGAFSKCENLTGITIPDSVTFIGKDAFSECENLTNIIIPESVTSIEPLTFNNCKNLTDVTIPESVTSIGGNAFNGTPWLSAKQEENPLVVVNSILIDGRICSGNVTIPEGVTSIAGGAFEGADLTSIIIPDSVTSIPYEAFALCDNLTSITIPDSVTSIGDGAFAQCKNLTSITIPESVTSIGNDVFIGCDDRTIKGNSGSYAETYAKENVIPFKSAEETSATNTTTTEIVTDTSHEIFEFEEVLSYPTKTEYIYGQELDFSGLEFTGVSKRGNTHTYSAEYVNGYFIEKTVSDKNGKSYGFEEFDTLPAGEYNVWITGSAGGDSSYVFCKNVYINYKVTIRQSEENPSNSSKYVFDKVISYPKKTVYAIATEDLDLTGLKFIGKDETGSGEDIEYGAEDCLSSITKFEVKDEEGSGVENASEDLGIIRMLGAGKCTVRITGKAGSLNGTRNCHDVDITFEITIIANGTASYTDGCTYGDANCDGEVNMADAVLIMQCVLNPDKYQLSELGVMNADVYVPGSGITNADALTIQRFKLGFIDHIIVYPETEETAIKDYTDSPSKATYEFENSTSNCFYY